MKQQRHDSRGTFATGRIVKLLVGQGHGFIRLPDAREVFFHRADLDERVKFHDFQLGDRVTFQLVDDAISGARALLVRQERLR